MYCQIHLSVEEMSDTFWNQLRRKVYVTPKSYLDAINLYLKCLADKRTELGETIFRLSNGLSKLNSTQIQVDELKIKLIDLKPELEKQNIQAQDAIKIINEETKIAEEKEKVVGAETEIVNKQAGEMKILKDEA
jgi:dynein heavy chain